MNPNKAERLRKLFTRLMCVGMIAGFTVALASGIGSTGDTISPITGMSLVAVFASLGVFGTASLLMAASKKPAL